jgi:hypothetical protein
MAESVVSPESNSTGAVASYAAYGQLIKMLLPSTGSIAIYDARATPSRVAAASS